MPLYNFNCNLCGKNKQRICNAKESKEIISCDCGGQFMRNPLPPTTRITETLDNGIMPRKVERLSEAERLFKERSQKKIDRS